MSLSPALGAALDRIAERAADVRRAYTPGALPLHDDVATPAPASDFSLDPLAVTAPDGAYFIVTDERGRRSYTRDGSFTLLGGRLVTRGGASVLGQRGPGDAPVPLAVDSVDESLGRVRDAAIERDGTLTYRRETIDPRSGTRELQRASAGRIALARFPAGTRLGSDDDEGRSFAPAGVAAREGLANDGDFGPLVPMHRERSRIDVDESLVRLKQAYLAFDALQAAEAANMHLGKTAMDLLK